MKMLLNEINYLLFLLLLQFGSMGSHRPVVKVVSFDNVIPPTLTQPLCAEIHDNVAQANNKKLTDCSMQYCYCSTELRKYANDLTDCFWTFYGTVALRS